MGVDVGLGVKTAATTKSFSQGALEATENPLDIAIEGAGFFQVQSPLGEQLFTRAGNFKVNGDGELVTAEGMQLMPPVTIPQDATSVSINRNGTIAVTLPNDNQLVEVGQLELANFTNPAGMKSMGRGLFAPTEASGVPQVAIPGEQGTGELSQGFLEGSNVQIVTEMIDMIVSQRAYEINSKVIRTADEMLRSVTNLR